MQARGFAPRVRGGCVLTGLRALVPVRGPARPADITALRATLLRAFDRFATGAASACATPSMDRSERGLLHVNVHSFWATAAQQAGSPTVAYSGSGGQREAAVGRALQVAAFLR